MPRNSSGTYTPPANTAAVSGATISSTAFNTLETDIGNELTNSLDRSGRGAMLANLPFGGFRGTGLADPSLSTDAATKNYVDAVALVRVPTGALMQFATFGVPSGWLECDGSAINRTTYAALFAAIGTSWGVGDGVTTFNIPDFRGYFARGWDHGRGVDIGRTIGTTQADSIASHNHTVTDPGHTHNVTGTSQYTLGGNYAMNGGAGASNPTQSAVTGITINNTGGVETRPKNIAVLFCIKT